MFLSNIRGSTVIWQRKHALTLLCERKQRPVVFTTVVESLQFAGHAESAFLFVPVFMFCRCPCKESLAHRFKHTYTVIRRAVAQ